MGASVFEEKLSTWRGGRAHEVLVQAQEFHVGTLHDVLGKWCSLSLPPSNRGDTATDSNIIVVDDGACTPSTQSEEDGSSIFHTGMRDVTPEV